MLTPISRLVTSALIHIINCTRHVAAQGVTISALVRLTPRNARMLKLDSTTLTLRRAVYSNLRSTKTCHA